MTRYRKLAALSVVPLAFAFVGTACSGDDVADKITEKAIEQGSGGDVDIDSEDGKITYKDDEGNETQIDVNADGDASLPDGFPADLAPPDNVSIISSSTNTVNGVKSLFVLGETDASMDDMFEGIKNQLDGAGYTIVSETNSSSADGGYAGIVAEGDYDVNVSISSDGSTTSISFSVTEPAAD